LAGAPCYELVREREGAQSFLPRCSRLFPFIFPSFFVAGLTKGKKPVLVAVEHRGKSAGFVAMRAVDTVSSKEINAFMKRHLANGQRVRTDALPAMNIIQEGHEHEKKVTPPEETSKWLPLVHIVIGNMKTFLNGTFHGVTHKYLQEYLDEFCYRFNRRFWESELPFRLLNACMAHAPTSG
jgi:hypothetical protein